MPVSSRGMRAAPTYRLPRRFDPERLRADWLTLRNELGLRLRPAETHDGGWTGLSLHCASGDPYDVLFEEPMPARATPALRLTPYFRHVVDSFPETRKRARVLCLHPGGRVFEHYDRNWSLDRGAARIHVPVQTHPGVRFRLGGRRQRWQPGEVWYGDFCFAHQIRNAGPIDRVHLVIDFRLEDVPGGLRELIPRRYFEPSLAREASRQINYRACDLRNAARRAAKTVAVRSGLYPA